MSLNFHHPMTQNALLRCPKIQQVFSHRRSLHADVDTLVRCGFVAEYVFPCRFAQCNQKMQSKLSERRTLSVSATGTVTAEADLAIVRVGYKLFGADAQECIC